MGCQRGWEAWPNLLVDLRLHGEGLRLTGGLALPIFEASGSGPLTRRFVHARSVTRRVLAVFYPSSPLDDVMLDIA